MQRLLVLLSLTFLSATHTSAASLSEQIIGSAERFLELLVQDYLDNSQITGRTSIPPLRLDPRLRLPTCDKPLAISQESQGEPIGRVTLGVRCSGSSPWRIFIPAEVRLYRDVVVMRRPMARKSKLAADDLSLREEDVSQLRQTYLTDISQATGQTLKRGVASGDILTSNLLQPSSLIKRGDRVVIVARSGDFFVKMQGEALSDGAKGQQIRIRNITSDRVIRARVVGPSEVEVAL